MSTDPAVLPDLIREAIARSFDPADRLLVAEGLASRRWLLRNDTQAEEVYGAILVVSNGNIDRFKDLIEHAGGYRETMSLVSGYDFRYPDLSHMELIQRYRTLNLPIPDSLKTYDD